METFVETVDVCGSFDYKTISSVSIVEDSVLVEVAFDGVISSSRIPAVDNPSSDFVFASFILAILDILFGATVAMAGKISFVRL